MVENKQLDYDHLEDQFNEFREESDDLVNQMEDKYNTMVAKMKE